MSRIIAALRGDPGAGARPARDQAPPAQALLLATAAAQDLSDGLARRLQLNPDDDFGRTCTKETEAVLACHQKNCPDVTFDGRAVPWLDGGCSVPGCDMSTCTGITTCEQIQCDIDETSHEAYRLIKECGDNCSDELWAFGRCGLTAAAEQFCGVPNCLFYFPSSGDNCKSDGAAATGLGFLTAAAAVAAAL